MKKNRIVYCDYNLVVVLMFIVSFGLVMLYSASAYSKEAIATGDSMYFFKRQAIFAGVGFVVMFIISKKDYHYYGSFARFYYLISLLTVMAVRTPLGISVNGAKRWLPLPFGFSFQPSEIMKVAVILLIPYEICKLRKKVTTKAGFAYILLLGGLSAAAVLFFTDNLSTAVIVGGITVLCIYVVYPNSRLFYAFGGVLVALATFLVGYIYIFVDETDDFRIRRILSWVKPDEFSDKGGYQVKQGLYALGSGGFFGKGLGNGTQKLGAIPEIQNDMILAAISEELGVFGIIVVLVLFGFLIYRLMFIARNAPDLYGSLIVTAIMAHISLQVILNVMVVTNMMPTTGVILPFISYGGTSLVFLLVEMGIALGVSRKIRISDD